MSNTIPTDAELQAYHRRRRWWVVRTAIGSLLAVAVVAMTLFVLTSSSVVSIEEAKVLYAQLGERSTAADFERLFGKSTKETDILGVVVTTWLYTKHHLFQTDYYRINMHCIEKGTVYYFDQAEGTITGWDSWRLRWWLLRNKLGIVEEW